MRIALVCFNRPDYLSKVLAALVGIARSTPLDLVVGVDAPRVGRDDDVAKVMEVRKLLQGVVSSGIFARVRVNQRDSNLGCWANKKLTVSEAFEDADHVLVLEDDIVPCADAIAFLNRLIAADVFSNEHLFQVSLFSYFFPAGMTVGNVVQRMRQDETLNLIGFRKWATPWGWLMRKDRFESIRAEWNGWDQWLGKYCSEHEMFEIYPLVSKCNNIGVVGVNRTGGDELDFQRRALTSDDLAASHGRIVLAEASANSMSMDYASIAAMGTKEIRNVGDNVYRYGVSLHPSELVGKGLF